MSKRLVYLCVVLRPMDRETLQQLLEQLAELRQRQHGDAGAPGHDGTERWTETGGAE